jgi:replicative DNA helicase
MTVTSLRTTQNIDYEQALLGACMSGWTELDDLHLTGDDFARPAHEMIWNAIRSVAAEGTHVDAYTVWSKLEHLPERTIGGAPYLAECLAASVNHTQAPWLAGKVAEASADRKLDDLALQIHQLRGTDRSAAEKRELAKTWIDQLGAGEQTHKRRKTPGEVLEQVYEVATNGHQGAVPTRWPDLNRVLDGWYPGQVITVAGRPGTGKSIFGVNCAVDMALTHGKWVYMASLEMTAEEITERIVAEQARVNLQAIRTGKLNTDDWRRVDRISKKVLEMKVDIDESETQTVASIRAGARDRMRRTGLGLIVVDYLLLVDPADPRAQVRDQISQKMRDLAKLGKELQVPIINLTQLRRPANEAVPPTMSDLKESGAIEENSHVVILLHWLRDDPAVIKAIVDKNRSGPSGITVELNRRGHYAVLD